VVAGPWTRTATRSGGTEVAGVIKISLIGVGCTLGSRLDAAVL
jgi:hypothetical protein